MYMSVCQILEYYMDRSSVHHCATASQLYITHIAHLTTALDVFLPQVAILYGTHDRSVMWRAMQFDTHRNAVQQLSISTLTTFARLTTVGYVYRTKQ